MRKYNYKAFKRKQDNVLATRVTEKDFLEKTQKQQPKKTNSYIRLHQN